MENTRFLVSGCSFSAEDWSWPSLLPNYRNLAEHGAGNLYIRRQIEKEILNHTDKYDFVIVQWSTIDRWDYPFKIESKNDTDIIRMNVDEHDLDTKNSVSYFRMGTNLTGKQIHFYQNYYSIYGQILETLESIYYTQLLLEKLNKPYLMFTIANLMTTDVSFDMINNIDSIGGDLMKQRTQTLNLEKMFPIFKSADTLETIKNDINWDKFIWTTDFKIDKFGDGFTEYLINRGEKFEYPKEFPNHPSERQNKNLFEELIKPRIIQELLL